MTESLPLKIFVQLVAHFRDISTDVNKILILSNVVSSLKLLYIIEFVRHMTLVQLTLSKVWIMISHGNNNLTISKLTQ